MNRLPLDLKIIRDQLIRNREKYILNNKKEKRLAKYKHLNMKYTIYYQPKSIRKNNKNM